MIRITGVLLALGAVVLGGAAIRCSDGSVRPARAVFLIVVDTLRPDRLSCYGYDSHQTPHIDALAERGVRFSNGHSVASWTIPSMGAMMTSFYPTQLGLTEERAPAGSRFDWQELRDQENSTISPDDYTLAEIFQEAGYRTAAFVDQPGLIHYGHFFQGFDDAYFPDGVRSIAKYDPDTLEHPKWPPFLRQAFPNDEQLVITFEEWLAGNSEHSLFVWLHLLTPHWPYDPPGRYMPNGETATTDEQKLAQRFYNGEVRAVDDLVGRITAAIEDHVGLDETVIVFTSDHGEALGEHRMRDHGHSLHAEVIRVPLIISGPSIPKRVIVDAPVRTIDILPTLLEFVDLKQVTLPPFEGMSLMPLLKQGELDLPVYSEAMLYGATERSLINGEFKVMYDEQEPIPRLFNVVVDPGELHNLAQQHPERRLQMSQELATIYNQLLVDRDRRLAGDSYTPAGQDERAQRALRALGYLD